MYSELWTIRLTQYTRHSGWKPEEKKCTTVTRSCMVFSLIWSFHRIFLFFTKSWLISVVDLVWLSVFLKWDVDVIIRYHPSPCWNLQCLWQNPMAAGNNTEKPFRRTISQCQILPQRDLFWYLRFSFGHPFHQAFARFFNTLERRWKKRNHPSAMRRISSHEPKRKSRPNKDPVVLSTFPSATVVYV